MTATTKNYRIRPIRSTDNAATANIIRTVMPEFGCVGAGYSIEDPEVDSMYENYDAARSSFYVVVDADDTPVGCGGVAPLAGGDGTICELKKMYFLPETRGCGFGRKLIILLLDDAKRFGFQQCYLETVTRMNAAQKLYVKAGFQKIPAQLGNTGHSGCDCFYLRNL